MIDEIISETEKLNKEVSSFATAMNEEQLRKRIAEIDEMSMNDADFWSKAESKLVLKEQSTLKKKIESWEELHGLKDDTEVLLELIKEGEEGLDKDIEDAVKAYSKKVREFELQLVLSGPNDANNAIITINSGAGGTEASDWAAMLYRMYIHYAENKGYKYEILDYMDGDEAGIKNATINIKGPFCYGYLKSETGQHINTTDSAVRITHMPTGIVVTCQNERSQHKNKASAMKILKSRLYEHELAKKNEEKQKLESTKSDIGWGNQIRSYVMHPYKMVKDLRTRYETGNVDAVMDGNLDGFIRAYLLHSAGIGNEQN